MNELINFLRDFDLQTIISVVLIFWWFARDIKSELRSEIKALEDKMDRQGERIDKQGERTDKLYEMFIDLLKEKKS
jgi:hypothetical protein